MNTTPKCTKTMKSRIFFMLSLRSNSPHHNCRSTRCLYTLSIIYRVGKLFPIETAESVTTSSLERRQGTKLCVSATPFRRSNTVYM